MSRNAIARTVELGFDEVDERVRAALADEGFGVLTEIDVQATLRKKLSVEFRRYEILGACNPSLAHRALEADGDIGLLLPCNVVVQDGDRPGTTIVEVVDPVVQLGMAENLDLGTLAEEVRTRLVRVLTRVVQDIPS
jgi:uncharacterized protein (DUF302 family)